jgi:hypothetical protein
MGKPLDVNWEEIKRVAELGADLSGLAAKFGISYEAIRKRSLREQWLVPHRLHERLLAAKAMGKGDAGYVVPNCPTSLLAEKGEAFKIRDRDTAESVLAETWETRGEQIRSQAWLLAQRSLEPVVKSGLMITTIKEAATAVDMARKAVGLDRPEPLVNLSIFGDQTPSDMENVYDLSPATPEDTETDDFFE